MSTQPSNFQIVVNIIEDWSRQNHQTFYEIEMVDGDTGALRRTFITPDSFNYRKNRWIQVIEMFQLNPSRAIIIDGNFSLARSRRRHDVIDADSKFEYYDTTDRYEVLVQVLSGLN